MRCTQIIGLSEEAQKFLNENGKAIATVTCPDCGKVIQTGLSQNVYGSARDEGMFDDGPDLYAYILKDESIVKEVVQASPWSSGPCIFLCLQDEDKNLICKWSEEEINNA